MSAGPSWGPKQRSRRSSGNRITAHGSARALPALVTAIDFGNEERCRRFGVGELAVKRQAPNLGSEPRVEPEAQALVLDPTPQRRRPDVAGVLEPSRCGP